MDWTLATVLPILALAALGALIPVALMRWLPDTQAGLGVALALSVVILTAAGTGLFALLYAARGIGTGILTTGAAARHLLALGLRAGLVWAPILALAALVLAQGIERRRGRRLAARDVD